jgi:Bacterial extracellular solute-binding proteins, family 5 Middle
MTDEPRERIPSRSRSRDRRLRSLNLVWLLCIAGFWVIWACAPHVASQGVPSPSLERPGAPATVQPPVSEPERPSLPAAALPGNRTVDCRLILEPGQPIMSIALGDRVDAANAPHPSNESERLLFRQLYESLVRVDCDGRMQPALASAWRFDAATLKWIVTLRENARFSDETPVTAAAVVTDWTIGGLGIDLRPEVSRIVHSIIAVDDRTLEITLRNPSGDAPLSLAHTDLAISRRVPSSVWPLGTGPYRIAPQGEAATPARPSSITLVRAARNSAAPNTTNNLTSLRVLVAPGRDARDLLDEGVDLLLTRDPTAREYAATLPQFVSAPLAWQRTHVLLAPRRSTTARNLSIEEREALAHDAVRGEARGAMGPFWWQSLQGCEGLSAQPPAQPAVTTGRIVYDGNDTVARDIAERLVGLVRVSSPPATAILDALLPNRPGRTYERATALTGEALALARRRGNDAANILALDARPLDPCREMQVVMEKVGWADAQTIVPLVDTRLQAIVRRGHSGVTTEWDGGLLLADDIR